jgi:hypothetical protein
MSIGEALTAARRQAGLTITQVSQRTRIRETIIRGIERDDFSACGGDFYARGHIRAIARAEGADPEPLVAEYDSSHGTAQASTAACVPGPPAPLRLRERRRPNWTVALLIVLLMVLAAAAGLLIYHLMASGPAGSATAAARETATAHNGAHRHPAATIAPAPPAALVSSRAGVISVTAVSEPRRGDQHSRAARRSSRASPAQGSACTWQAAPGASSGRRHRVADDRTGRRLPDLSGSRARTRSASSTSSRTGPRSPSPSPARSSWASRSPA